MNNRVLTVLKKGDKVPVLGEIGAWYKVSANGKEGYAVKNYLSRGGISVTSTSTQNNSSVNLYRNFSSIRETYSLLERVARELEYSDIPALYDSANNMRSLAFYGYDYWILDGYRFYSNQALLDYKIQKARNWGSTNDQTGDGVINCQDYAELFYRYASSAGYHVRYIVNSQLNHAFNAVNVNGHWVAIEPQAAEDDGLNRSPEMSVHWTNYNPAYDTVTKQK